VLAVQPQVGHVAGTAVRLISVTVYDAHDTAALTEAFRRSVLRCFVRRGIFEREDAEAMLAWPHPGFHVHDAVLVPDGDMDFALRLARYCARNPVALDRLEYDATARQVRYRSDKLDGPTALPLASANDLHGRLARLCASQHSRLRGAESEAQVRKLLCALHGCRPSLDTRPAI
jgi:hypothetical protein